MSVHVCVHVYVFFKFVIVLWCDRVLLSLCVFHGFWHWSFEGVRRVLADVYAWFITSLLVSLSLARAICHALPPSRVHARFSAPFILEMTCSLTQANHTSIHRSTAISASPWPLRALSSVASSSLASTSQISPATRSLRGLGSRLDHTCVNVTTPVRPTLTVEEQIREDQDRKESALFMQDVLFSGLFGSD